MDVIGIGYSDVGNVREENEDTFLVDNEFGLYLICDGMGGAAAGKQASQIAATKIQQIVAELKPRLDLIKEEDRFCRAMAELVQNAVQSASDEILKKAKSNPAMANMGSTASLLLISGTKACVGHVGDSRIYLLRDGEFHQLTKDHTVVQELIEKGAISPEKAASSPYAHVLTRALGRAELVPVDTLVFEILPGDRLLICCDGVSSHSSTDQLHQTLAASDFSKSAELLVGEAKARDGSDNITAVIVGVSDQVKAADHARGEEVRLQLETLKQMYIFSDLTMQELLRVMDIVRIESCAAGEEFIIEGEEGNSLYIILQGSFSVERQGQVITTLSRGNHFGEMSLLNNSPRSATVKAIAQARLLRLDREDFMKILLSESLIGVKLLWKLSGRLSHYLNESNVQIYGE